MKIINCPKCDTQNWGFCGVVMYFGKEIADCICENGHRFNTTYSEELSVMRAKKEFADWLVQNFHITGLLNMQNEYVKGIIKELQMVIHHYEVKQNAQRLSV